MAEESVGCAKPTGTVIGETTTPNESSIKESKGGEKIMITARVGLKAPDFAAPAYHKGKFITVKLSDYQGKWVLICFYPGDFTFV